MAFLQMLTKEKSHTAQSVFIIGFLNRVLDKLSGKKLDADMQQAFFGQDFYWSFLLCEAPVFTKFFESEVLLGTETHAMRHLLHLKREQDVPAMKCIVNATEQIDIRKIVFCFFLQCNC